MVKDLSHLKWEIATQWQTEQTLVVNIYEYLIFAIRMVSLPDLLNVNMKFEVFPSGLA